MKSVDKIIKTFTSTIEKLDRAEVVAREKAAKNTDEILNLQKENAGLYSEAAKAKSISRKLQEIIS